MSDFTDIAFRVGPAERELAEFKALLDSKSDLAERPDILNKLPHWRHMLCGLGTLDAHIGAPNRIATEFDIAGRFRCDLVVGHSVRLHYLFVEFEGANPDSIFKSTRGRRAKKFGNEFTAGLGQLLEWFWWNGAPSNLDLVHQQFGGRYVASTGLLVLGRDAFIDSDMLDRNRWDWTKTQFRTNPLILLMTYDEMYRHLAQCIAGWKDDLHEMTSSK
ncbi:MAG TPA: Shedu anti-phage system protein SduA domain-containing protein [Xanthobacteraceae bacterium]|nr:Shedu anti-phage system protein SduA domain-containing protein [Xanthobacteraceae bacterium]